MNQVCSYNTGKESNGILILSVIVVGGKKDKGVDGGVERKKGSEE